MDELSEQNLPLRTFGQISADENQPGVLSNQRKTLPPNSIIEGRFKIVRLLGRGGTGTVYQVEQILLKRDFALKVLDPIQVTDDVWRRFQKEAQAAGRLDHAGFLKVHDFGLIENQVPYFTMDLVDGETLSARLKRVGAMPVADAVPLFLQLCFALDYAHSQGVIHRDLKPSNIAITKLGSTEQIKILDFGIAKLAGVDTTNLTQVGAVFGTPYYMSPEQCQGQQIDRRCDVYSLGCVFFEMLTGAPPFTTENALSLMMQHQSEKPPSLKEASMGNQYPLAIEKIVAKMLEKNPNARYQTLADTAADLMEFQQGKVPSVASTGTRPAINTSTASDTRKFNPLLAYTAVVTTSLLGVAVYFLITSSQTKPEVAKPPPPSTFDTVTATSTAADGDDQAQLLGASTYFSHKEMQNGIEHRIFEFPKTSIGDIFYVTDRALAKKEHRGAAGRVDVPFQGASANGGLIGYNMDWNTCLQHPQYLGKFRPDELGYLSFSDNDGRKFIADDTIYDNSLMYLDGLKSLYSIELPPCTTSRSIPHIDRLPNLIYIGGRRLQVSCGELARLNRVLNLTGLGIGESRDVSILLRKLQHSKVLKSLLLYGDDLQDADLKTISECQNLEKLDLRGNPKITDAGLTHLIRSTRLERLLLDGCNITPGSIQTLGKLKVSNFISLDLSKWSQKDINALLQAVKCDVRQWNEKASKSLSIRNPALTPVTPEANADEEL